MASQPLPDIEQIVNIWRVSTRKFPHQAPPGRFGQLPRDRGLIFICRTCGRPHAVERDTLLRTWGERGVIADAARRLRCSVCRARGMKPVLSPTFANLGSPSPVDRLVQTIRALIPKGWVD